MTWRERTRAAKLTQRAIASLLGYTPSGVSLALDRDPPSKPVRAVIRAWELMSDEQRQVWLDDAGV